MTNNHPIRALIIDDEPSARQVLRYMIENYKSGCKIVGEASTVASGIEQIKKLRPDLLLLDVELPDGTGFDILDNLETHLIPTIFITAFSGFS